MKPDNSTWRRAAKNALSGFKGWQAVPAFIIALYLFFGIFGPLISPYEPNERKLTSRLCPPPVIGRVTSTAETSNRSAECRPTYVLGTDQLGRDIFSRMLHGFRESFLIVGPSVLIGVTLGTLTGILVNGSRPKLQRNAYLLIGATIIPFSFYSVAHPYGLYILSHADFALNAGVRLANLGALASIAFTISFALVAAAYRYDQRCVKSWFNNIGDGYGNGEFRRHLRLQLFALAPWIVFALISSSALVFGRDAFATSRSLTGYWSVDQTYLFDHIGMYSPMVPLILIPIALITFGTWWGFRYIVHRFDKHESSISDLKHDTTHHASNLSAAGTPSRSADLSETKPQRSFIGRIQGLFATWSGRKPLLYSLSAIAVALILVEFVLAVMMPTLRGLQIDPVSSDSEAYKQSRWDSSDVVDCMNASFSEGNRIDPDQRCTDVYLSHRNAPTHHATFRYLRRAVPQTFTLALFGSVGGVVLALVTATYSAAIRSTLHGIVGIITMVGLTITFGALWWLTIIGWQIDVWVLFASEKSAATQKLLTIARDLSIAVGLTYFCTVVAKSTLHFRMININLRIILTWSPFMASCVGIASGLILVFHAPFPSNLLVFDHYLSVIVGEPQSFGVITPISFFRNWLWTYWFALIAYAAIVFLSFSAAIWGFRQFTAENLAVNVSNDAQEPARPNTATDPSTETATTDSAEFRG